MYKIELELSYSEISALVYFFRSDDVEKWCINDDILSNAINKIYTQLPY